MEVQSKLRQRLNASGSRDTGFNEVRDVKTDRESGKSSVRLGYSNLKSSAKIQWDRTFVSGLKVS